MNSNARFPCLVHTSDFFKDSAHISIAQGKPFVGDFVILTLPQRRCSLDILARLPSLEADSYGI